MPIVAALTLQLLPLLWVCYFGQIIGYTIRFHRRYRTYKERMGNFFSDDERHRLRWVGTAFFSALALGVLAMFYALLPSVMNADGDAATLTAIVFTIIMGAYYAVFGLLFINYTFTFLKIEKALKLTPATSKADDRLLAQLAAIMTEQRLYTKPDLTIEELAVKVGESYRSVSETINHSRDENNVSYNFKTWVNHYRVEEAIRLIGDGYLKQHTTAALAETVGFSNRINFHRVFKRFTGYSPSEYTESVLNPINGGVEDIIN